MQLIIGIHPALTAGDAISSPERRGVFPLWLWQASSTSQGGKERKIVLVLGKGIRLPASA